jgi:hypothetical protein
MASPPKNNDFINIQDANILEQNQFDNRLI